MAIQPIDLQALFAQQATVGRTQAAIKAGQELQQTLSNAQAQKKTEENTRSVNETQELGKEASTIKERTGAESGSQANQGKQGDGTSLDEDALEEDDSSKLFRNPALGRNIDISG